MSKTGRKTRRQHQYHTYTPSLRRRRKVEQYLSFVKLNVKQSNLSPSSLFVKLDVQKGQTFRVEPNIKQSKCLPPPHHLLVKLDVQKGETFLVELNIKWSKWLPPRQAGRELPKELLVVGESTIGGNCEVMLNRKC